jgi:hypothetical protein
MPAPKTEWTVEIKACSTASVSAILGGNVEGCVIYDTAADTVKSEFTICGGVVVGIALKVGAGVDVSSQKLACAKANVAIPLDSADKIKQFLKSDAADSKEAREILKAKLLEQLKASGVPQDKLDEVKRVEFGPFHDGTGREQDIKDNFNSCGIPPLTS